MCSQIQIGLAKFVYIHLENNKRSCILHACYENWFKSDVMWPMAQMATSIASLVVCIYSNFLTGQIGSSGLTVRTDGGLVLLIKNCDYEKTMN